MEMISKSALRSRARGTRSIASRRCLTPCWIAWNARLSGERRFTSDASHELRTPVAAILAQADFALSPAAKEEDRVEALEDVRARAGQMSELLGKLLALSRMDAGHTPLRREKVDVRMLLEVALEECADAAREKISPWK